MKSKIAMKTILTLALLTFSVAAQTSVFKYDGYLTDGLAPANGIYQLRFTLYDAATGGTAVGSPIEAVDVQITDGDFTVELDFGATPFNAGADRYLQIEYRYNSGGIYTAVAPRRQITGIPYATRARSAQTADNADRLDGVEAADYVQTDDPRMTDAREPVAGSDDYIQNRTTPQTGANFNIDGTGRANIFAATTRYDLGSARILSSPGGTNTFLGFNTGPNLTTGDRNTFIGRDAGTRTTTGRVNTFAGSGSGYENTTGSSNSFYGFNSGLRNTTGSSNSFYGVSAGSGNLVGGNNSFFGYEAGLQFNPGYTGQGDNSFFGAFAGRGTTTGTGNVFLGAQAGRSNTSGQLNVFVGHYAGYKNTNGEANVYIGREAGYNSTNSAQNVFIGYQAGRSDQASYNSTFVGFDAGGANRTGEWNTFIGTGAGEYNTTGRFNSALGVQTRFIGGDIEFSTAIGAGATVTTNRTVVLGTTADQVDIPGTLNVLSGNIPPVKRGDLNIQDQYYNADLYMQGGNGSKGINFGVSSSSTNARLFISQYDGTTYLDRLLINPNGAVAVTTLASGGYTSLCRNSSSEISTCSSARRYKTDILPFSNGLGIVRRLRPVSFRWIDGGPLDFGLVAEEVAEIEPLLTTRNADGAIEGIKYDRVGVVLISAVNEQQKQIEVQTAENEKLRNEIGDLKKRLDEQTRMSENLRRLVCADRPEAELCRDEKENE
jgi:hypothetical protein